MNNQDGVNRTAGEADDFQELRDLRQLRNNLLAARIVQGAQNQSVQQIAELATWVIRTHPAVVPTFIAFSRLSLVEQVAMQEECQNQLTQYIATQTQALNLLGEYAQQPNPGQIPPELESLAALTVAQQRVFIQEMQLGIAEIEQETNEVMRRFIVDSQSGSELARDSSPSENEPMALDSNRAENLREEHDHDIDMDSVSDAQEINLDDIQTSEDEDLDLAPEHEVDKEALERVLEQELAGRRQVANDLDSVNPRTADEETQLENERNWITHIENALNGESDEQLRVANMLVLARRNRANEIQAAIQQRSDRQAQQTQPETDLNDATIRQEGRLIYELTQLDALMQVIAPHARLPVRARLFALTGNLDVNREELRRALRTEEMQRQNNILNYERETQPTRESLDALASEREWVRKIQQALNDDQPTEFNSDEALITLARDLLHARWRRAEEYRAQVEAETEALRQLEFQEQESVNWDSVGLLETRLTDQLDLAVSLAQLVEPNWALQLQRELYHWMSAPDSRNATSGHGDSSEMRRDYIFRMMTREPRQDAELSPKLEISIKPWAPAEMSTQEREDIVMKFKALREKHESMRLPANPERGIPADTRDAASCFSAVIFMAEASADFEKYPAAFKQRMWNLIRAVIDKNHPAFISKTNPELGGMTDEEHLAFQDQILNVAAEALGACVDRVTNGIKLLERIVHYAKARHFKTIDEHFDLARKMYIDDVKDYIAEIKSVELQMDGYRFPENYAFEEEDRRRETRKNPDESLELSLFYGTFLPPDYQLDETPKTMLNAPYVISCVKKATPTKADGKSDDEIGESLMVEVKEIIDHLLEGQREPAKLQKLWEAAEATLVNDKRKDEDGMQETLTDKQKTVCTFEDYLVTQHVLWEGCLKERFPEIVKAMQDKVDALRVEERALEKGVEMPPGKPPMPPHRPRPPVLEDNADDVARAAHAIAREEYENAMRKFNDDFKEYEKEREKQREIYEKWKKTPAGLHYAKWDSKVNELHDAEYALPLLVRDLTQQYLSAKPILDEYKKNLSKDEAAKCKWEPLGREKRIGFDYVVVGSLNGKTCLRLDGGKQRSIRFVVIDSQKLAEALLAQGKDPEIKHNEVFRIHGKDGEISKVEVKKDTKVKREADDKDVSTSKRRKT